VGNIKFGGKQTMADKMAVAKSRVGKNPGVSKGAPKPEGWKAKPRISASGGGKVGVTFTKRTGKSK
jgi:hypothetical protein